jgi:hypothetical protein
MTSPISRWFEQMKGRTVAFHHGHRQHIEKAAGVVRQGGESLVVGGLLGALATQRSLDYAVKLSPTNTLSVPIDGAVGALALAASMVPSLKEVHEDLKNAGSAALAVAAFRKTQVLMHTKAATVAHGEFGTGSWGAEGEDPLIAVARSLT